MVKCRNTNYLLQAIDFKPVQALFACLNTRCNNYSLMTQDPVNYSLSSVTAVAGVAVVPVKL